MPGSNAIQMIKQGYSSILLVFSIALIVGIIFTEQTRLSHNSHPVVALVVLLVSVTWLTMVEGGQGALVGLGPVDPDLYKESHKLTHKCTTFVFKGDNLNRYLLGRQFMVILIVFVVELSGAYHSSEDHDGLWGLPGWLITIFLGSGLAMIMFTCMVGQLNSEIIGCHYMLDYLNSWFAVITIWVAMGIEFSGILHICYLVQQSVGYIAGQPIQSNEPPRGLLQNIFFYGRCLFSIALLAFSFAVTFSAIFQKKTTVWESVPPYASVIIFFVLMGVIGVLEGSQIAYFACVKMQKVERGEDGKMGYFAKRSSEILFRNENHNLAAFLVGRQLCVVSCMFFIARITAVKVETPEDNIFGVPNGVQKIFNTGLLGAIIVAVVASVSWRLIASAFPLQFFKNPIPYFFLRFCLVLEMTGILHGAWVIANIIIKLSGVQRDEIYIGTAEERAAALTKKNSDVTDAKAGQIIPEVNVGEEPPNYSFDEDADAKHETVSVTRNNSNVMDAKAGQIIPIVSIGEQPPSVSFDDAVDVNKGTVDLCC